MKKEEFYILFNYGTQSENLVKRKGWRYKLDNGVVIFVAKDRLGNQWTSYENTTGNYILSDCKTKKECLEKTLSMSDKILDALSSEFNIEKAKAMKDRIELGIYEEWF